MTKKNQFSNYCEIHTLLQKAAHFIFEIVTSITGRDLYLTQTLAVKKNLSTHYVTLLYQGQQLTGDMLDNFGWLRISF